MQQQQLLRLKNAWDGQDYFCKKLKRRKWTEIVSEWVIDREKFVQADSSHSLPLKFRPMEWALKWKEERDLIDPLVELMDPLAQQPFRYWYWNIKKILLFASNEAVHHCLLHQGKYVLFCIFYKLYFIPGLFFTYCRSIRYIFTTNKCENVHLVNLWHK